MGQNAHIHTLCWDCSKACGGCDWSDELIPVKGWVAEKTRIKSHGERTKGQRHTYVNSYIVQQCPQFDRDSVQYGQKWTGKKNQIIRRRKKRKP